MSVGSERVSRLKESDECGSQGANLTAGVHEREDASRTREAGDSVLVKTENVTSDQKEVEQLRFLKSLNH